MDTKLMHHFCLRIQMGLGWPLERPPWTASLSSVSSSIFSRPFNVDFCDCSLSPTVSLLPWARKAMRKVEVRPNTPSPSNVSMTTEALHIDSKTKSVT